MIIKRMDYITNLEEFIRENKEECILLTTSTTIDISIVIYVIKTCEKINKFLEIGIGRTFFRIEKCNSKGCSGCPYYITDENIDEVIKQGL